MRCGCFDMFTPEPAEKVTPLLVPGDLVLEPLIVQTALADVLFEGQHSLAALAALAQLSGHGLRHTHTNKQINTAAAQQIKVMTVVTRQAAGGLCAGVGHAASPSATRPQTRLKGPRHKDSLHSHQRSEECCHALRCTQPAAAAARLLERLL